MNIISWDIETYLCYFCISAMDKDGFIDYETSDFVETQVVRDYLAMLKNYDYHTTFNGKAFDIKVLAWIASDKRKQIPVREVGEAAQLYIAEEKLPFPLRMSPINMVNTRLTNEIRKNHFDVMCYLGNDHSLKWWELARGWSVKESDTKFDAETMSDEEYKLALQYCHHDVEATYKLSTEKDCTELIEARKWLLEQCPKNTLPDITAAELSEVYCYQDEQVPEEVGSCMDIVPWNDFDVPAELTRHLQMVADHTITGFLWNGKKFVINGSDEYSRLAKEGVFKKEDWAAYGAGGAHYVNTGRNVNSVINDVASLYPHIIKHFTKLKTNKALGRYVGCIDKRIANKRKKGTPEYSKAADKGLKLVLNSLSGKFGMKGATAYAPEHRLAMCIIGQLLITEATVKALGVNPDGTVDFTNLVEINTDSFAVIGDNEVKRAREYCAIKQHGAFAFEEEIFVDSYWKDVNHYVVFNADNSIKEVHGEDVLKSEYILLKSVYANCRKPLGAELELVKSDDLMDYVIKYSKPGGAKNAKIDGVPMKFKNYYFMWVTKECPNSCLIQTNADTVNCGVWAFDPKEFEKYKIYIDYEQYKDELRHLIKVWKRPDLAVENPLEKSAKQLRASAFFSEADLF